MYANMVIMGARWSTLAKRTPHSPMKAVTSRARSGSPLFVDEKGFKNGIMLSSEIAWRSLGAPVTSTINEVTK